MEAMREETQAEEPQIGQERAQSEARLGALAVLQRHIRELLPTLSAECRVTAGLDSDGSRYAAIASPTLVVAGGRSPQWLRQVQPRLAELMPHARYVLVPELDHNAPDESAPAAVADLVRAFLTTDAATAR